MAGQSASSDDAMITEINVTPLVDIMLVLLIIFMLTANLMVKQAIVVELPRAASGESVQLTVVALTLTRSKDLYINGKLTTWANLQSLLPQIAEKDPQAQAIVAADQSVTHGEVIRLVDMIRLAGIVKFALNVEPGAADVPTQAPPTP